VHLIDDVLSKVTIFGCRRQHMQLKAIPSDFQVDEVYSPQMFSEGDTWRVYLLMKQKYNIMDALRILAKNSAL
jgi:tRNA pseudouridine synthase D (TruD).